MAKLSTLYTTDFSGGLNTTAHQKQIERNESSRIENWDITNKGQLKRRDGLIQVGASLGGKVDGLHSYLRTTGLADLLAIKGGTLYYLNVNTWTALDNGFTSGNLTWMENVALVNKVFISNEDDTLHSWDRTSTTYNSCLTDLGSAKPHGNVMRWHKNHLFHLNNVNVSGTKYPHRMYWSDLADPTTYNTGTDFVDVPAGGRLITAVDMGDYLVLFKEHAIQYLSGWGSTDWQITDSASNVANIDESIGCIAPRGATRVGNEIWFMDDEGIIRRIYQTDFDAFRRDVISTKLEKTLAGINKVQLAKTIATTWNDKVYFAVPTGSSVNNNLILVFDLKASKRTGSEAWTTYTGWTPTLFTHHITSTTPDLYIGDVYGGIYRHDGKDDNGVAIAARWDGREDDFDRPERDKRFKFGYITAPALEDVDIGIYSSVDNGSFSFMGNINITPLGGTLEPSGDFKLFPTGTTAILAGGGSSEFKYYFSSGGGKVAGKTQKFSIRHAVANQQPVINGYTAHFKERALG